MYTFSEFIEIAAVSFQLLILVRVLIGWAPVPLGESEFTGFLRFYTDPLLKPLATAVPFAGTRLDLAPLFALMLIFELGRLAIHLVSLS